MHEEYRWIAGGIGGFLLAAGLLWFLVHPTALRDEATATPRPFSYARVQLWLWTGVILLAWVVVWARQGVFLAFNGTCLALLGISVVTTVSGRLIDNRDMADPNIRRHQDDAASKGFFQDILSDDKGPSVHRFQSVVFNIAYAISFLIETFTHLSLKRFHEFDAQTLALLGVSSGTYIAMKAVENKPRSADQVAASPLPSSGKS